MRNSADQQQNAVLQPEASLAYLNLNSATAEESVGVAGPTASTPGLVHTIAACQATSAEAAGTMVGGANQRHEQGTNMDTAALQKEVTELRQQV